MIRNKRRYGRLLHYSSRLVRSALAVLLYLVANNSCSYAQSIVRDISTPIGFTRFEDKGNLFGNWLRDLKLKADRTVYLFNGERKLNQSAQYAVVDVSVGNKDLQQCADACMRLRAEFLFSKRDFKNIHFRFTSGDNFEFTKWIAGYRPKVKGNKVLFVKTAKVDSSYVSLSNYLEWVFRFCGTASLERELASVKLSDAKIGDVIIQGGFPGHAVIIIDKCVNSRGESLFMLSQSFMPAQSIHVIKNQDNGSAWFSLSGIDLTTPEWVFNNISSRIFRWN